MLIMANTHSNEPAALLATLIFMENAIVEKGTLILIPMFNHSGSRNTRPGDGYPLYFEIPTDWGSKKLRMGNRDASIWAVGLRMQVKDEVIPQYSEFLKKIATEIEIRLSTE